ncbi:DsrE family protein [Stenotrophomonas sp. NLF4-10]|uniref:DsrE family protein n=1 Tax=Stenotrophomonas sp. NLF4-10 TaxID=2918754 RepID=UPI001EFB28BD|nr:DsrE family protein [Stenotrophomonas sp. NLF4-10]MCG8277466.1 DsrE family protein [Stenotrophomonas sp. NLF4-10]
MEIVVLLRDQAAKLALREKAFAVRLGRPHADAALIATLINAGVRIEVCAQSLHRQDYPRDDVDPRIPIQLSALLRRE